MMLTIIDVCLMLNCFFFEKFYLQYALCDFDSILLHCTKLFIRQSIDREQIFDVTFKPPLPPIEKSCVRHWPCLTCRNEQMTTKIKYTIKVKCFQTNQNIYQKLN